MKKFKWSYDCNWYVCAINIVLLMNFVGPYMQMCIYVHWLYWIWTCDNKCDTWNSLVYLSFLFVSTPFWYFSVHPLSLDTWFCILIPLLSESRKKASIWWEPLLLHHDTTDWKTRWISSLFLCLGCCIFTPLLLVIICLLLCLYLLPEKFNLSVHGFKPCYF
jgi:hypothetical protein